MLLNFINLSGKMTPSKYSNKNLSKAAAFTLASNLGVRLALPWLGTYSYSSQVDVNLYSLIYYRN